MLKKILLSLGFIFFYGNITLYSQVPEIIEIGDFIIQGEILLLYMGEAEHVVIPDNLGITRIGENAFRAVWAFPNENLKSIIIPEGITGIGYNAFEGCYNLTSIILPEGLVDIEKEAFRECESLTNIIIPKSVIRIGAGAFSNCYRLESITIPENVISRIDESMFARCINLKNITVDKQNIFYSSSDGILFDKFKNTLIKYPAGKTEQTYIVYSGVRNIKEKAFSDSKLTSITINEKVNSIGDYAFDECNQLVNITINEQNGAYSSDDGVLFNKDKTTLIKYPDNKNERTYIIPSSVTLIKDRAFNGSRNLEHITIPSSVVSIKQSTFANCINLKTIVISRSTKLENPESRVVSIGPPLFGSVTLQRIDNPPYDRPEIFFGKGIEIIYSEDQ